MKILVVFVVSLFFKCSCSNISRIQMDLLDEIRSIRGHLNTLNSQIDIMKRQPMIDENSIRHLEKGPTMCNCAWSGYINGLGAGMNYSVPNNRVFAGLFSWHDDWYQDREWKVYHCQVC